SPVAKAPRSAVTHIYFLLVKGQISRFHKVLHDEIWNFYEGSPLRLIQFDGVQLAETMLGPGCETYVSIVPPKVYQASETTGEYSLVGCTVAPGFDFADFSFLKDDATQVDVLMRIHADYQRFL
ncbi:MAG: cupin domain-containing protein, partial [SAR324 cluster bacterium]|nr:cupin domain-containing protein [SAR324 cluster bacterium]